jgi:hypothetical protein
MKQPTPSDFTVEVGQPAPRVRVSLKKVPVLLEPRTI